MIGILALHGGVEEHEAVLDSLGLGHKRVRSLGDVEGLSGLIIPGGESTVMKMFLDKYELGTWIQSFEGPIYGTCAGMIVLADLGLLDAEVERNAYGRQLDSFVTEVIGEFGPVKAHFIRAPKVVRHGGEVEVLMEHEGVPVLIRQGNVWASSFHPELAGDSTLHAAIFV